MIWLPLVAGSMGFSLGILPYHHFFGAIGPGAAAFIVAGICTGERGVIELARQVVHWRVGWQWYVVALCGPALLFLLAAISSGFFSWRWIELDRFGASEEFPQWGLVSLLLFRTLTFGLGEEIGWRGFALPRLQRRRSALSATLLLSLGWALWHWPMFLYRPGYSSMDVAGIVGWFFSLVTGAILLTWLYNSTQGSVLIVSLFSGSVDLAFTSQDIGPDIMNIMGSLIVLWAILVVVVTRPATLSCAGKAVRAT